MHYAKDRPYTRFDYNSKHGIAPERNKFESPGVAVVIACSRLFTDGAEGLGTVSGTHVNLDGFSFLAQLGTCINKAGEMVTRIEQTGE